MRTKELVSLVLVACSLAACGVGVLNEGETDGREAQVDAAAPPRIVLVAIDDRTVEWGMTHSSRFDGLPIGAPGPDKRFREVMALVLEQTLAAAPAGLAIDMEFYSNPPEGAQATEALARVLQEATAPVTLCSPQSGDELALEGQAPVYRRLPEHAYRGHCKMWGTPEAATSRWTIYLDEGEPLGEPLSVVAYARSGGGVERARSAASCLVDETEGIPVKETNGADIISGAEVLAAGAAARLQDAIVVVGATFTGCGDIHRLLPDGVERPGVYTHLWTMLQLAHAPADCASHAKPPLRPLPPLPD